MITLPQDLTAAEREAAELAVRGYREFVAVYDDVQQGGGSEGFEKLQQVAVQQALESTTQEAAVLARNGWHLEGSGGISWIRVASVSLTSDATSNTVPEVMLTSCETVGDGLVYDRDGNQVTPKDNPSHYLTQTTMRYYPDQAGGWQGWFVAASDNKGVAKC